MNNSAPHVLRAAGWLALIALALPARGATAPAVAPLGAYAASLQAPARAAADAAGNLYVTDPRGGRVVVFDSFGRLLAVHAEFAGPLGLAVDALGRVYVGEEQAGSVSVFDGQWNLLYQLGSGPGEFQMPNHIAVDPDPATNLVFVADSAAAAIKIYCGANLVGRFGTPGTGSGQFDFPAGVCVSTNGEVFVVDQSNDRVQVFDRAGGFRRSFKLKTGGMGLGQSGRSQAACLDRAGRLYVADSFQGTAKVFDAATGAFLGRVGSFGELPGQLSSPAGLALDPYQRLAVTSANTGRLELYGLDGYLHLSTESVAATNAAGAQLVFRATTGGSGPFTYQWWKNGALLTDGGNLSGASSPTLTINGATPADAGGYAVVVGGPAGAWTSGVAQVAVLLPPTILQPPVDQDICAGGTAALSVAASGDGTLSYQWLKDGVSLSDAVPYAGATTATLTVAGAESGDAGSYVCVVSNQVGGLVSAPATLTVRAATGFDQPPADQLVCPGSLASFAVTATGDGSLSYRWQKNETDLTDGGHYAGAATATLTVTGVDDSDVGSYRCVATGGCGATVSTAAGLALEPPELGVSPASWSFGVLATGTMAEVEFVVTNAACGTLTGTMAVSGEPFSLPAGTGLSVPAYGSTTVRVRFRPTAVGTFSGEVVFDTTGGVATQPVAGDGFIPPPAAPDNLVATAAGGRQVLLTWQDYADSEDGFRVERAAAPTGPWTSIAQLLPNTITYRDRELWPATAYSYRVVAYNAGGESAPSLPASVVTPALCNGSVVVWSSLGEVVQPPAGLTGVVAVAAGFGQCLALKSDGTVLAWGPASMGDITPPSDLSNVVTVAAGSSSLALRSDGSVVGWGDSGSGLATPPAGLGHVTAIAAGGGHQLALTSDGTVTAWGTNDQGQATPPAGLDGVVAIAAGGRHSLALTSDGMVIGWGANDVDQLTPPAGLHGVVAIAAGGRHSLALTSDGTVIGWGDNTRGQATAPALLSNVVAIAAGTTHSLALTSDGLVVGWGDNSWGQALPPLGLTGVVAVAGGQQHSVALTCTPPAPTGLVATVVSASRIDLAWSDNSVTEDGFAVERSTDGTNYQAIALLGANSTGYTDSGLAANTLQYYRVRAYNAAGGSGYSNTAQATTPSGPTPVIVDNADPNGVSVVGTWVLGTATGTYGPNQLVGRATSRSLASVRFTPNLAVAGTYQVYLWYAAAANRASNVPVSIIGAGAATNTVLVNQQINGSQWVLLGSYSFTAGTAGSVLIRTDRTSGYVIADAVRFVPAGTVPPQPPLPPTNLVATAVSSNQINLGWTDTASNEDGFQIERSTDGLSYQQVGAVGRDATSFADAALAAGRQYFYRVRAYNAAGGSGYSNTAQATTAGGPTPIIVDNADPNGVTVVGPWVLGTATGTYGPNQLVIRNTGRTPASVRFAPYLAVGGTYQVYLWYTAASNRAPNVPVSIIGAGGATNTVLVNQQLNGSQWLLLGSYSFTAGTAGSVLIRTDGTSRYVIADAVRFVPAGGSSPATLVAAAPLASQSAAAGPVGSVIGPDSSGTSHRREDGSRELVASSGGLGELDSLYFDQVPVQGNCVAVARVQRLESQGAQPLAGLMIREELDPQARFVSLATTVTARYRAAWFRADGEPVADAELSSQCTYPVAWLALARVGDEVTLFTSADGIHWDEAATVAVPQLADQAHLGLFLTSGTPGVPARALITDFAITPLDGNDQPKP